MRKTFREVNSTIETTSIQNNGQAQRVQTSIENDNPPNTSEHTDSHHEVSQDASHVILN